MKATVTWPSQSDPSHWIKLRSVLLFLAAALAQLHDRPAGGPLPRRSRQRLPLPRHRYGAPGAPALCAISAPLLTFQPLTQGATAWAAVTPEVKRKLLQAVKNMLSFRPYGYSKEKCILASCS